MKALATRITGFIRQPIGEGLDCLLLAKHLLLLLAGVYFSLTHKISLDPMVQTIQEVVQLLCIALSFTYISLVSVRTTLNALKHSGAQFTQLNVSVFGMIDTILIGITVYFSTIWALGEYGVSAKEWIIQNPTQAIAVGVSVLLVQVIIIITSLLTQSVSTHSSHHYTHLNVAQVAPQSKKPSNE
jgi:hypothetical protein